MKGVKANRAGYDGALVAGEAAGVVAAGGLVVVVADGAGGFVWAGDDPAPCCYCGPARDAGVHFSGVFSVLRCWWWGLFVWVERESGVLSTGPQDILLSHCGKKSIPWI